jgi:two-component system response regulator FixJ
MMSAPAGERTVYVVDDDDAVRDALSMLFRTAGLRVETFPSAVAFLQCKKLEAVACLVLDIRMPGLTGLALQEALSERKLRIPIIFITGHGDIPMAVEAVKKGAYDFIEKPFDDYLLLCQVLNALERGSDQVRVDINDTRSVERLAMLTEREREVLDLVLAGKPSRQVAAELHISVKTVEFHRARIMQKLNVRSAAELFRVCLSGPVLRA